VAGVGLQTIRRLQKHRGYSPQEFLQPTRLTRHGNYDRHASRVIDVAYGCGFAKLSQFGADYAKLR
jgi:transcriptional regulator GlxA family with amidase domain